MVQLEFTKIREVKSPNRANEGDAGLDFYIPQLSDQDILKVGEKGKDDFSGINRKMLGKGYIKLNGLGTDDVHVVIKPGGRLLIPSGIKVLINPKEFYAYCGNSTGLSLN